MPYADPEAKRAYDRERVARRRADYLADKSCVRCGLTDHLEIDHVDPSKKVSHRIWSWSDARLAEELAKCQVLCRKHHLEKTLAERVVAIPHGTDGGYTRHKCRCTSCTEAHRVAKQAWRDERKAAGLAFT